MKENGLNAGLAMIGLAVVALFVSAFWALNGGSSGTAAVPGVDVGTGTPTANDDITRNVFKGSIYIDEAGPSAFIATDNADGAAVWESISGAAGGVHPVDLTSDVTGALPAANGGTGQTAATADSVLVGNGSAFAAKVIPDCDTSGDKLQFDISTDAFTCEAGGGGTHPVDLATDVTGTLPSANGGTGQTAATADGVLVGTGAAYAVNVLPDCDTAGDAINYDQTTDAFSCAGGYLTTVDISDDTNLAAGTGATLTGDTISVDLGTSIDISDETNLAAGTNISLTGDQLDVPERTFAISIEDPTSSEDITIWSSELAITIDREECVVLGSSTPSVTVTLRHGTDRSAAGAELNTGGNAITSTTTGDEDVSFNDATIVADSWIWLETTAQSGTVDLVNCSWDFTVD